LAALRATNQFFVVSKTQTRGAAQSAAPLSFTVIIDQTSRQKKIESVALQRFQFFSGFERKSL
jgi:hypothetical protein